MLMITPTRVKAVGIALAAGSAALFLHGASRIGVLAGLAIFLIAQVFPKVFAPLKFAKSPAWPSFVALGVASLIVTHGLSDRLIMAGLLTAMVGNFYDVLY